MFVSFWQNLQKPKNINFVELGPGNGDLSFVFIETLKNLVDDLYWEFDRMSSSGQKTLDEIAKIVGTPTNSEMDEIVAEKT